MLRCRDGSLYTGITTDVARRINEHEGGTGLNKGAKYLKGKGPLRLELQKSVSDRSVALKLEYKIKGLTRYEKEKLIAGEMKVNTLIKQVCADD